jgi:hypothetical protein
MKLRRESGPVALRKHAPGLTDGRVSATRPTAAVSMNQLLEDDQCRSCCPRNQSRLDHPNRRTKISPMMETSAS